jgi:hypothetical protein
MGDLDAAIARVMLPDPDGYPGHRHLWFTLFGESLWRCRCGQVSDENAPSWRSWTDPELPVAVGAPGG